MEGKRYEIETEIHRELLRLAEYHKALILKRKETGLTRPDDDAILKMLNDVPRLVSDNIKARKNFNINQAEEEKKILKKRQLADCSVCNKRQKVKIIKGTINKQFGWKLDVVRCTVCKNVFTNYFPNNWHDIMKWMENFQMKLYEVNEDGKTMAEIMQNDKVIDAAKSYQDYLKFKDAQLSVEENDKKMIEAIDKAYKSLESFHEYLFMTKLKGENWNNNNNNNNVN